MAQAMFNGRLIFLRFGATIDRVFHEIGAPDIISYRGKNIHEIAGRKGWTVRRADGKDSRFSNLSEAYAAVDVMVAKREDA